MSKFLKPFFSFFSTGFDVNAKDKNDITPLMNAIYFGQTTIVYFLLDSGADINAKGVDGNTPLMWAVKSCQTKIAQLLVDKGADINLQNNNGDTALMVDPWHNKYNKYNNNNNHIQIFQFLLDKGADVTIHNKQGKNTLTLAAENARFYMVQILQKHGMDISPVREVVAKFTAEKEKEIQATEFKAIQKAKLETVASKKEFSESHLGGFSRFFGIGHDEAGNSLTDTNVSTNPSSEREFKT